MVDQVSKTYTEKISQNHNRVYRSYHDNDSGADASNFCGHENNLYLSTTCTCTTCTFSQTCEQRSPAGYKMQGLFWQMVIIRRSIPIRIGHLGIHVPGLFSKGCLYSEVVFEAGFDCIFILCIFSVNKRKHYERVMKCFKRKNGTIFQTHVSLEHDVLKLTLVT